MAVARRRRRPRSGTPHARESAAPRRAAPSRVACAVWQPLFPQPTHPPSDYAPPPPTHPPNTLLHTQCAPAPRRALGGRRSSPSPLFPRRLRRLRAALRSEIAAKRDTLLVGRPGKPRCAHRRNPPRGRRPTPEPKKIVSGAFPIEKDRHKQKTKRKPRKNGPSQATRVAQRARTEPPIAAHDPAYPLPTAKTATKTKTEEKKRASAAGHARGRHVGTRAQRSLSQLIRATSKPTAAPPATCKFPARGA